MGAGVFLVALVKREEATERWYGIIRPQTTNMLSITLATMAPKTRSNTLSTGRTGSLDTMIMPRKATATMLASSRTLDPSLMEPTSGIRQKSEKLNKGMAASLGFRN